MKKGLSILLVAAALFGFYGGAININDVLACKDYWEKAGEESTANMNKLEDGLNQLKENEQAYLDGQDQLADGEKALADGEKALADGEAQYAEGLKSYKEAPAKLAAGEAQLAEGKKSYGDLKKLINGLAKAKKHGNTQTKKHDTYWHDAYSNALVPGKQLIVKTLTEQQSMVGMLEMITGASDLVSKAANAKSVEAFDGVLTKELKPTFEAASKRLTYFAGVADEKSKSLSDGAALHKNVKAAEAAVAKSFGAEATDTVPTGEQLLAAASMDGSPAAALKPYLQGIKAQAGDAAFGAYAASKLVRMSAAAQNAEFLGTQEGQMLQGIAATADGSGGLGDQVAAIVGGMKMLANDGKEGGTSAASFETVANKVGGGLSEAATLLNTYSDKAQESADQFQLWDDGYQTLAHGKDGAVSDKYPDDLASKSSGIPYAFKNMVSNSTIKAAVKAYDKSLMSILKKYSGNRLQNDSMEQFDKDIVYLSTKVIPRAEKVLAKVKKNAEKQLADGEKQLKQGKADYAAAPGKLADAERQLADGRQQLEEGRQALEDGKAQLAQYEDGEQQVRDGLSTLTDTEADLDLESIADRLKGDTDFDNGDEHLDIDEGLAAVEVGRGYQADDGVLISKEIMARAVGTGALLGAGALAILAAILSFLKKNKAAGVFAILAAAAGAFGAFYGTQAGTYFSSIAGSTVGATGWVAAGILGAVALVHSIVHFTAKKDA